MSKKLLSTLIASLFAAAPAFGQSLTTRCACRARRTIGGIHNDSERAATRRSSTSIRTSATARCRTSASRGATARPGSRATARTSAAATSTCTCAAACTTCSRRSLPQRHPAHVLGRGHTPYNGTGGNAADGDVPAGGAADPTRRTPAGTRPAGLRPPGRGGYGEWQKNSPWYFRVDGNQVSSSGTGSVPRQRHEPGQRLRRPRVPEEFKTSNWGVEGGYQSSKATLALRWDYSKFENSNETLRWTNPYFGPTAATTATLDTT